MRDESFGEGVVDGLVHEDALHTQAVLACLREGPSGNRRDGAVEVGIGQDEHG